MSQFIVVPDENGNRVFINLNHVKKVAEQKSLIEVKLKISVEFAVLVREVGDLITRSTLVFDEPTKFTGTAWTESWDDWSTRRDAAQKALEKFSRKKNGK